MELTTGLLKAIDSAIAVTQTDSVETSVSCYMLKYKDKIFGIDKIDIFHSITAAENRICEFIHNMFRHHEYWQSRSENIKQQTEYDIDFSESIKLFPQYGQMSRFRSVEYKNMITEIKDQLLKQKIFIIKEI